MGTEHDATTDTAEGTGKKSMKDMKDMKGEREQERTTEGTEGAEKSGEGVWEYEYIRVLRVDIEPGKKTPKYLICNRVGCMLGLLSFSGAWRQYVFIPEGETQWSAGCLADVQDAIARAMAAWRAARSRPPSAKSAKSADRSSPS